MLIGILHINSLVVAVFIHESMTHCFAVEHDLLSKGVSKPVTEKVHTKADRQVAGIVDKY